jgi:cytochrome c oxidase accessory protein FixG
MSSPAPKIIQMYAARQEIYPREISGRYNTWRWVCLWLTQLVFYGLPWLSWNGRQAVLFDLVARKFYIFGIVLWPQDFIYLALLLIVCAYSLFLVTAVAGRVWCGFACPQTVYTEMFLWIERKTEGTRSARMALDRQGLSLNKIIRKGGKHTLWGLLALWTGFTFVAYFTPITTLLREAGANALSGWELWWVLFYALATYGNAGWLREQVCKYMCPYARFQSAMFDKDTLIITYDAKRGEPRGAIRKNDPEPKGDCIDCSLCVQVCPTGIDIRKGLQYECIGCAACIDACDAVMTKVERPLGLIRYSTDNALAMNLSPKEIAKRAFRPRVMIYSFVLWLIIAATATALLLRSPVKLDVLRDRGSMGREVEEGAIENVYRLQIMNTSETARSFRISVAGLPTLALATPDVVTLKSTETRAFPVRIRAAHGMGKPGSNTISFTLQALDEPKLQVTEAAVFIVPH